MDVEADGEDKFFNEADIELKYASAVLGDQLTDRLAKENTVAGCLQTMWQAVGLILTRKIKIRGYTVC